MLHNSDLIKVKKLSCLTKRSCCMVHWRPQWSGLSRYAIAQCAHVFSLAPLVSCELVSAQTMAIEFSPDASILGCACDDGSVRLWKVAFLHESTGTVTGQFGKSQVRPDPTASMPGFVPVDPVTMVRVHQPTPLAYPHTPPSFQFVVDGVEWLWAHRALTA